MIYSYGANEEEQDGILDEENPEDTSSLDQTARDFLDGAILDYNQMFHTNYDTSSDKFQSYYKDVSLRMKNKGLDMLIAVNMFLTGFDATTLNTLWVDKNLKMHGLIQAFSRTNRILNSIKIDYILMLVKKYHDTHCEDKEVLITIRKAIEASPELRSKKELIYSSANILDLHFDISALKTA